MAEHGAKKQNYSVLTLLKKSPASKEIYLHFTWSALTEERQQSVFPHKD